MKDVKIEYFNSVEGTYGSNLKGVWTTISYAVDEEDEYDPLGTVRLFESKNPNPAVHKRYPRYLIIEYICINENHRREGIATLIVGNIIKQATNRGFKVFAQCGSDAGKEHLKFMNFRHLGTVRHLESQKDWWIYGTAE